jgi:protein TonB
MTALRRRSTLHIWIIVSVLVHIALILIPIHFLDIFFPRKGPTPIGTTRDLTPDFAIMAMKVITPRDQPSQLPASVTFRVPEEEEATEDQVPDIPQAISAGQDATSQTGATGSPAGDFEPPYFPPVPRYIVPPTLDGLNIGTITLDLRILVGATGRPVEVVLPDTLTNEEVRRRLMESVRRFRFEPARRGDRPISTWIDLPLVLESATAD